MGTIRVLGPVEVIDAAGAPVVLAPRGRRLLAALAVRANQVASTDWLVDAVWADDPPLSPEAALQTLVSRLRTVLRRAEGPGIATCPGGYRLEVGPEALDALVWEALLRRAAQAVREPGLAAGLLGQALALWRGPAFGDLAHDHVVAPEAARLSEQRVVALEDRAELLLAAGEPEAALPSLTDLVGTHPFRERPVRLLMVAQHRLGRTAEALDTFHELRGRLADELGLDPSPDLLALQTGILNHDPSLDRPESGQERSRPAPAAILPRVELIGRGRDRRDLADAVGRARLVTVIGPGGVGKTSLVAELLSERLTPYAQGAVVAELSRIPTGSSLAATLATVLQIPVAADQVREDQLVSYLVDRELLLVLDSCEHVVGQVAELVDLLLRSCVRLRVLSTSRIPLRLPGEQVFALRPLEVGTLPGSAADPRSLGPAVQLFLARARQRVRDFDAAGADLATIVELCSRLDGLPLAIELAASQMDALSPRELLGRLGWRLTVLRGGAATDPRHRTLGALVDWSYERLTAPEQQLFEIVSVFAGRFTLDEVEGLVERLDLGEGADAAAVLENLVSLVEQSMVARGAQDAGFLVLETLRTYGRERLAAGPLARAAPRAHAEMFAKLAGNGYDDLYGAGQVDRADRLERAVDELRAAFRWACEQDELALAAELVGGLAPLVEHKLFGEAHDWAEELLDRAKDRTVNRLGRVYAVAAAGARFAGKLEEAAERAHRALELSGGDATAAGYAYLLLGEADFFAGRLRQAMGWRDQVARLAADHDQLLPLLAMMDAMALLAAAYSGDGRASAEARALQQRAERRSWPVVAAWALYVRGEVLIDSDPVEADALLHQALARARALDERYLSGVALVAAASARSRHGDPNQAVELFVEVVRHWRDRGDWTHQWTTLRNVLDLLVRLDRLEPATVLAAALLDPGRPASGYGADAERLAATAEALAAATGPGRHAELGAEGRSLTDQQVVSVALAALAHADLDPGSAVQPVEAEEAEVLDGQHRHLVEPRPGGVVLQDRPAEHRARPH